MLYEDAAKGMESKDAKDRHFEDRKKFGLIKENIYIRGIYILG